MLTASSAILALTVWLGAGTDMISNDVEGRRSLRDAVSASASSSVLLPPAALPPRLWRERSGPSATRRDPLSDGTKKGAWIGGLSALGAGLLLTTRCDGGCDDPSMAVFIPAATAVGAGVGAMIGFIADAIR